MGGTNLPALLRGEVPAPRPATAEFPAPGPAPTVGRTSPAAPSPEPQAQWEQVEVRGLRVERTRDFGESYLGLALWHRLKLDEWLARLLPAGRESVEWSRPC